MTNTNTIHHIHTDHKDQRVQYDIDHTPNVVWYMIMMMSLDRQTNIQDVLPEPRADEESRHMTRHYEGRRRHNDWQAADHLRPALHMSKHSSDCRCSGHRSNNQDGSGGRQMDIGERRSKATGGGRWSGVARIHEEDQRAALDHSG